MARAVKVAECAAMYFADGELVWDDYLRHQQFTLSPIAQELCHCFARFTDPADLLADLTEADAEMVRHVIDELLGTGVLIEQDSPEHETERRVLAAWGDWGHAARYYHFASRTLADSRYASHVEQEAELDAKLAVRPAPAAFRSLGVPGTPLPRVLPTRLGGADAGADADADADHRAAAEPGGDTVPGDWAERPLAEVLLARQTTREFSTRPVDLSELAAFLQFVVGPSPVRAASERSSTVFKLSASAGGRHPIEAYVHAGRVTGLEPGWFHYDAAGHALGSLDSRWTAAEVAAAAGDQEWIGSAAVVVYYIGVLERVRWKYDTARTYRMLQMDVGHLSQTAYLVATALGLGVGFSAALRDELIERALGLDPNEEIVLGLTALGHSA